MQSLWTETAASGFRMTGRTTPGRYGLPFGNRDSLRPTHPPPAGASLRAGVVRCPPLRQSGRPVQGAVPPVHRRTLPREWHIQAAAR